ncbi:MAG: DMT family transporter [Gaiellaceae bacterium MAG52_C11]|nr:DMT family transporter [Candidatus Gaiellasilicea maunaloa]
MAWSTAGGLQRELSLDTATQLAGRAFFAFVALSIFVAVRNRGRTIDAFRSIGIAGLGVAVCTAIASGSFIVALNQASVANVLFMQAVSPIAAALLAWIALGESVTRRAGIAMAVALLGVGLMVGGPGSGGVLGVGASLVMTLAFAVGVVITRHRRDVSMAPAICLSQLLLVVAVGPFSQPTSAGERDLVLLVLLGVGQMGLGLVLFTMGARLIAASEVALITLLEVVLGPFWAWVAVSETPAPLTVVGGAVVVAAVLLQTTGKTAPLGLSRPPTNVRRPRSRPGQAASPLRDPSGRGSGARRRRPG